MSLALTVASMTSAGCTAEQINTVVQAHEAERQNVDADRRAKKAAQKRKERELSRSVAATPCDTERQEATGGDTLSPKERSPTPPKEITPYPTSLRSESVSAREAFSEFRKIYQKRDGSQPWAPAEKKFLAICRGGVDPDEILIGARAYAESQVGGDAQFVPQAVTWLNQTRWRDEHHQARAGPKGRSNGTRGFMKSVLEDIERDERSGSEKDTLPAISFQQFGRG